MGKNAVNKAEKIILENNNGVKEKEVGEEVKL